MEIISGKCQHRAQNIVGSGKAIVPLLSIKKKKDLKMEKIKKQNKTKQKPVITLIGNHSPIGLSIFFSFFLPFLINKLGK